MAKRLSELLGQDVIMAADVVGPDAQAKAAALQPGQILLLENTRFEKGETKNDPELAKAMASMADLYVSDAFGAVHRAHASTAGVAAYLPAVSGFLIQKELEIMGGALANPKRPLVAILGGSKVSSKIGVINNLLDIADTIIIGGGMAYTFSAAQGGKVGDSLLEADWESYANDMVDKAAEKGVKLLLPVDTVCADDFAPDAESQVVKAGQIPDGWQGLDIGPETVKLYCDAVADAGTVIWNGPMGVFEFPAFAKGTEAVAEALSETERHHHHRRRRQRGGRGAAGLRRQDDPHLHRRRRLPGVHGGQGAARRGLPSGQVISRRACPDSQAKRGFRFGRGAREVSELCRPGGSEGSELAPTTPGAACAPRQAFARTRAPPRRTPVCRASAAEEDLLRRGRRVVVS